MLHLTGKGGVTSLSSEFLSNNILDEIAQVTGASGVRERQTLQELWSGYGGIIQLELDGANVSSLVLKLIDPPAQPQHPRGWNTNSSHQRKLRSYQIETHWYKAYAHQCDAHCAVPKALATGSEDALRWILMEDLNQQYPRRCQSLSVGEAAVCLEWLAAFHAQFFAQAPTGLWPVGTYWHLDTRTDELNDMPVGALKTAAPKLDERLNSCEYQCLVHGDAKLANFCFSEDKTHVAAVDFQYVGGGVGIKDVVYFLGSCLNESDIEHYEQALLSTYFSALKRKLCESQSLAVSNEDERAELAEKVEESWRGLYAIAWTDFYRFLEGWMPGHTKINRYTKKLAERAYQLI